MSVRDLHCGVAGSQIEAGEAEALVRENHGWLVAYSRTILPAEDALDAAQETHLCALRDIHAVRNPAALRGWLRKIALRTCARQRNANRPSLHLEELLIDSAEFEAPGESPAHQVQREWLKEQVRAAVNALEVSRRSSPVVGDTGP